MTHYDNDPQPGLTQVLSDGTATYLYGVGRIAQLKNNMQYFGVDALSNNIRFRYAEASQN